MSLGRLTSDEMICLVEARSLEIFGLSDDLSFLR